MKKLTFSLFIMILAGCMSTKYYSLDYYEKNRPAGKIEFVMKDGTVHIIHESEIGMTKKTNENYEIYFQNGEKLVLKIDQIAGIRLADMEKADETVRIMRIIGWITGIILMAALTAYFVSGDWNKL
ncbi:MAG: hypothetical protein L0Y76_12250 [Ignavibacteria bacterium]|nr:hypothetical protein [Ignavibacteria bacterium]